ncbi:MAG: Mycobacterial persistence response regulator MprA, partial [uncultured Pseudonocardia sp.]
AHPRRRRRPVRAGVAAPLAGLQRLPGRPRRGRPEGAGGGGRSPSRRDGARRDDAAARRAVGVPAHARGRGHAADPRAHRPGRRVRPGGGARRRRRRLPAQAVRAGGAARPAAGAAAPADPRRDGRRGRGEPAAGVRRPRPRPRHARRPPRRPGDQPHPHRVLAAGAAAGQPEAGAVAGADPRAGVGLRLRDHRQRAGGLHRLPAPQDRGRRRAAADPHGARGRLRPAGDTAL